MNGTIWDVTDSLLYFTNLIIFIITWTYWILPKRQVSSVNCFFANAIRISQTVIQAVNIILCFYMVGKHEQR